MLCGLRVGPSGGRLTTKHTDMTAIKVRVWNGEQMISPDYIDRLGYAFWKENSIPTMAEPDKVMLYTGL